MALCRKRGQSPFTSTSQSCEDLRLFLARQCGALLAGFELVLTYWLYTYIPWFFPFAAIAVLAPAAVVRAQVDAENPQLEQPQPAPAAG